MSGLDRQARDLVEKNIDFILKDPKGFEKTFRTILKDQGIEPNLETVLSHISGFIQGLLRGYFIFQVGREISDVESDDLADLMKRRAWEVRQAFINTRIEG